MLELNSPLVDEFVRRQVLSPPKMEVEIHKMPEVDTSNLGERTRSNMRVQVAVAGQVKMDGELLHVSKLEFVLIACLTRWADAETWSFAERQRAAKAKDHVEPKVYPSNEIEEYIWWFEKTRDERAPRGTRQERQTQVMDLVRRVRNRLEGDDCIKNLWGSGYQFMWPVTVTRKLS